CRPILHPEPHRLRAVTGDCEKHHRGQGRIDRAAQRAGPWHRNPPGHSGQDGPGVTTAGTLLLVDDEQKIRRMLGQALRAEGHEVLEAAGAREAQRVLAERPIDVLIIDNLMPDMTGLDLIKELVATTPETERPQIL